MDNDAELKKNRLPPAENFQPRRAAIKIAMGYAAVSWVYIITSDRLVFYLTQDVPTLVLINSAKGSAFVFLTALGLYALTASQLNRISGLYESYVSNAQELETAYERITASEEELRAQYAELEAQNTLLQEQKNVMRALFENMHDAFALHEIICDENGDPSDYRFLFVNRAFEEMVGRSRDELVGRTVLEILPTTEKYWITKYGEVALTGKSISFQAYSRELGRHFSTSAYCPEPGHFAMLALDISEQKKHEETIERLAYSDPLTGLPNRTKMQEIVRRELEKKDGNSSAGALLFIDMDDLKMVNDTFDHSYGDAMIVTASMLLVGVVAQVVGPSYVSRIGGDEFIVLMPGVFDRTVVARVADELIQTLSREYEVKEVCFHASASVGIAMYPEDGVTPEDLLKNADAALYEAKKQGKSCWKFYLPALQQATYEKIVMTNHLRHAMEDDELFLVYQPQQNLAEDRIVAFEALLRWRSRHLGNVSPAQFIPLAEKSNLIETLGEWVLTQACRFAKTLVDSGHGNIRVAVNVSPRQLAADGFLDKVKHAISQAGIEVGQIEIEITESVLLEPMEENIGKLRELHDLGVHLALDDFGTGYSSLTYLRWLPVDIVKIDKSFIDAIAEDATQVALIASVIQMAHVLGLKVVAEGVETVAQWEELRKCGCDIVQGYALSRPVPEDDARRFLAKFQ